MKSRETEGDDVIPASIRTNNPGAMYPGPSAKKFGSTGFEVLNDGKGNKIAVFPDKVAGAAAQFDLLRQSYTGKTLRAAITRWSGGNDVETYLGVIARDTGLSADDPLTPAMLADASKAIPIAKAMAWQEAGKVYPLSDAAWSAAFKLSLGPASVAPAAKEVAASSRKWSLLQWIQATLGLGGASTAVPLISPDLGQSVGMIKTLSEVIKANGIYALGGAIVVLMILIEVIKHLTVQDAAEGRYTPSGTTKEPTP